MAMQLQEFKPSQEAELRREQTEIRNILLDIRQAKLKLQARGYTILTAERRINDINTQLVESGCKPGPGVVTE